MAPNPLYCEVLPGRSDPLGVVAMSNKPKLIFAGALLLLALVFVIQNAAMAQVRFLFWSLNLSQSLVIMLSAGVGILAGWTIGTVFQLTRKPKP